jgi:hypothetical protein
LDRVQENNEKKVLNDKLIPSAIKVQRIGDIRKELDEVEKLLAKQQANKVRTKGSQNRNNPAKRIEIA